MDILLCKEDIESGITGNAVMKDGKVANINYISSLNFRIAKQVIGASNKVIKYIINEEENSVYSTLIVSPPGAGKTTILRDLIRKISNGIEQIGYQGINVGVVDERGEIAAMYRGSPQNDVGMRTDVLDNVSKSVGLSMLIRSMAPKVIAADEIGNKDEIKPIMYAVCSGVKGIFTAHGASVEDVKNNPTLNDVLSSMWLEYETLDDSSFKGEKLNYLLIENNDSNVIMTSIYNYIICMKSNKDMQIGMLKRHLESFKNNFEKFLEPFKDILENNEENVKYENN